MRVISADEVVEAVAKLCLQAACCLPEDVLRCLNRARDAETSGLGQYILQKLVDNANLAKSEMVPICQDTGVAVFFVEMGQDVRIVGRDIYECLDAGTELGYRRGYLRLSIAKDPLFDRSNTGTNTPPIVHLKLVPGEQLRITLAPKGGGSENMSAMAMLKPLVGKAGINEFVLDTVRRAGGNPCPPIVVGLGMGGNFERAPYLAKKALLRPLGQSNPDPRYAQYEQELLEAINQLGVGPQGLGGTVTALAVHIEVAACHIASLPVAVNLNCHAARHASVEL